MANTDEDPVALAERRAADKLRKKAEKEAKQKQKEANQKMRGEAQKAKDDIAHEKPAPNLTLLDYDTHDFGDLFIQSHSVSGRTFTKLAELIPDSAGKTVWVRARVATSRKQGKALCFLQLRESIHTAQAVVYSKDSAVVSFAAQLPRESVIDVFATVTKPNEEILSCSQAGVELQVSEHHRGVRSI